MPDTKSEYTTARGRFSSMKEIVLTVRGAYKYIYNRVAFLSRFYGVKKSVNSALRRRDLINE